jgi:hypothetical protein
MASPALVSPAAGVLVLATVAALGYLLYQVRSYRLLCRGCRHLRDLRAAQREVYRRLEAVRRRLDSLLLRLPGQVRPEPYTADDERAASLSTDLKALLDTLRARVRPLESLPPPTFAARALIAGHYRRELPRVRAELAFVRGLQEDLARAEQLLDELESVLERMARRPLEVRELYVDLEALAEALVQEIGTEQERGTEGLQPLVAQAQRIRATALEWAQRLAGGGAEAVEAVVEAEALRPQLLRRLADLYAQAGRVAGMHDQALRALERLDAAQQEAEEALAQFRPPLAAAMGAALRDLKSGREALRARYGRHDTAAYLEVSQQAWALVARARSLVRQIGRLAAAEKRTAQALSECQQGVEALRAQLAQVQADCPATLDLSSAALERAEQRAFEVQELWHRAAGAAEGTDPERIISLLGDVEVLARTARQEQEEALTELGTWQARWRRIQEVLRRLQASEAEHDRISGAWAALQGYDRANWSGIDPGWFEWYTRERAAIMADASEIRQLMASGQATQSAGAELVERCEGLSQHWQALLREGQRVIAALGAAQAAERQLQEDVAALLTELQEVEAANRELPADLEAAAEVRALGEAIMAAYRQLAEQARRAASHDLRRLHDEGVRRIREQLAVHRLSYGRILEEQHGALRRRAAELWERWEPLSQRLAKATPLTEVDYRPLAERWEALVQAVRRPPARLGQVIALRRSAEELAAQIERAEEQFREERERVRQAELAVARVRRTVLRLRESLPRLLASPHPWVVDEEWERSTRAWRQAEGLLRSPAPHGTVSAYLRRLDEASGRYREAGDLARSALVRVLRYAFLEDPEGMHQVCVPMGRRWGRLGVTTREGHIRELLTELEQAGQLERLIDRVSSYLTGRRPV